MRKTINSVVTCACIITLVSLALAEQTAVEQPQTPDEKAWEMPRIALEPRLAEICAVSRCEWISGMTCRITYNGRRPLPSEVFFTEFDARHKQLGPKTRLIYPKLKKGESGMATFFLQSDHPRHVLLTALWNGPWRNPY